MADMLPFIDLQAQRERLGADLEDAVLRVVRSGRYILGPEVEACEQALAALAGTKHCLTCASGTDALALALMAKGIKAGDAVLCPTFTFAATAEVVAWLGAVPIFCDVEPTTFNIDVESAERGLATARGLGLEVKALIVVDLFGHPADFATLEPFADANGLWLLDDAAQGFGATYQARRLGGFGAMSATSFFPAKPLGCYGDGGAITFDDDALVEPLLSLRVHGQGTDKYDNVRIGMNGRMDTIQCAVILEKLKVFDDEISARGRVADRYAAGLGDVVRVPTVAAGCVSTWAQYTLTLDATTDRDAFQARLRAAGIPTAVYYGKPLHRQTAYAHYPVAGNGCPVSEALADRVVSLPMHPYLDVSTQDRIVDEVRMALAAG